LIGLAKVNLNRNSLHYRELLSGYACLFSRKSPLLHKVVSALLFYALCDNAAFQFASRVFHRKTVTDLSQSSIIPCLFSNGKQGTRKHLLKR
jgi:hypothetical protein